MVKLMTMTEIYWKNRKKQLLRETMKKENQSLKRIQQALRDELKSLNIAIGKYYSKYGADKVFQYERLLERMSDVERQELYEKTKQFMNKHPNSAFLTDVRNSYYKLQRLDGLKANILIHIAEAAAIQEELLPATLAEVFDNGYKKTLYNEAMFYGVETFHAGYDIGILKRSLNSEWVQGGNFSKRIWKNNKTLIDVMQNDFVMWVARGDSVDKITSRLANKFDVAYRQSERLVRTESAFMVEQGTLTAYEENGTEEYKFLAILDNVTSKICRSLDDKVFKIINAVVGVNYPPMHPHCRSTTISAKSKIKVRTSRLEKGYQEVPYMSYPKWEKEYLAA
ncbi:phage head morphogenesis protein [Listeria monocytogenes]|nr:phage head morphogenesis protein [Listeria monocytogenes]EDN9533427.1 phage head morphogenesis protein [Listeria monocytogenes]EDN9536234.1 phage head morphogenesis protein [Listeria monocytogenes]